ncbi:GPI-anchor transamidase-like [Perognathus longimembris pacificus]|uniref:GPI-anchor transamidase-like n=1 Tax=Perognathus longimembris pacificus TaxID=214514 RepID=UPI0020190427|nr:GPI-anchor transamidase-like [Perognathus longimembris pacificus]
MYERFYSPNMALASSQVGEDSLSHQPDPTIGVHLMDRYTFYVLEFLEEIIPSSQKGMNDLLQVCPKSLCVSTPRHCIDLFQRNPKSILITEFFGSVWKVEITTETIHLKWDSEILESSSYKEDQIVEELIEPLKYAEQLPVAQITPETKAKRLASSWGLHSGTMSPDYHGFLQNLWNQAYEVHFLDSVMCEEE